MKSFSPLSANSFAELELELVKSKKQLDASLQMQINALNDTYFRRINLLIIQKDQIKHQMEQLYFKRKQYINYLLSKLSQSNAIASIQIQSTELDTDHSQNDHYNFMSQSTAIESSTSFRSRSKSISESSMIFNTKRHKTKLTQYIFDDASNSYNSNIPSQKRLYSKTPESAFTIDESPQASCNNYNTKDVIEKSQDITINDGNERRNRDYYYMSFIGTQPSAYNNYNNTGTIPKSVSLQADFTDLKEKQITSMKRSKRRKRNKPRQRKKLTLLNTKNIGTKRGNKIKEFHCGHCSFGADKKTDLQIHKERKHNLQNPYQCVECGKHYSCKSRLDKHKCE